MNFTKYDKYGAYHWKEFDMPTQYREHVLHVCQWLRDGHTLDAGAGDGLITAMLNSVARPTVGIDDNATAVALAKQAGQPVEQESIYDLAITDKFDNIYLGDVIEHLEHPHLALERMAKALRPDGILYLVTPPAKADGQIDDPLHYFEWTPDQMEHYMHQQGWTMQTLTVKPEWRRMYATFTFKRP